VAWSGPTPLERTVAIAAALALHILPFALWPSPGVKLAPPPPLAAPSIPVAIIRIPHTAIATAPLSLGRRVATAVHPVQRRRTPAAVSVAEREIIDQGNGVTMTIDGIFPPPPAPPPDPPPEAEKPQEWLQMDVWVAPPVTPPYPSEYCVPSHPQMPARAFDLDMTGRVSATWTVDTDGVANDVDIVRGAPPLLTRAVRDWLHGCLFVPAQQGGKRTTAVLKQSFLFEIR
jgi:hypothetical protein